MEEGTSSSVNIWKGTMVGVIAQSGSGKSTFLRVASMLASDKDAWSGCTTITHNPNPVPINFFDHCLVINIITWTTSPFNALHYASHGKVLCKIGNRHLFCIYNNHGEIREKATAWLHLCLNQRSWCHENTILGCSCLVHYLVHYLVLVWFIIWFIIWFLFGSLFGSSEKLQLNFFK